MELANRGVKRALDSYFSRLSKALSPCIDDLAGKMFEKGFIPDAVNNEPESYKKVINAFKANFEFVKNLKDLEEMTFVFLDILRDLGGAPKLAAGILEHEFKGVFAVHHLEPTKTNCTCGNTLPGTRGQSLEEHTQIRGEQKGVSTSDTTRVKSKGQCSHSDQSKLNSAQQALHNCCPLCHLEMRRHFDDQQALIEKERMDHEELKRRFDAELQAIQEQEKEKARKKTDELQSLLEKRERELNATHSEQPQAHGVQDIEKRVQTLCVHCEGLEGSWKISHKELKMTECELGRGAWGCVSVGIFREHRVAVKQLYKLIMSEMNLAVLRREINIMCKLRHPCLVQFIGAVIDHPSGSPLIVTEIMDTSLRQAYEKGQLTDKNTKLSVLRDTAAGLNYLHGHPDEIIHRDVSSTNVLLESRGPNKWRAKLSDFGSANIARNAFTQAAGCAVYGAPEAFMISILDEQTTPQQSTKIDVFSYGVLLCEVMTCTFPSDSRCFRSMHQSICSSSPPIGQLIQSCVHKKPEDRPTMEYTIQQIDKYMDH